MIGSVLFLLLCHLSYCEMKKYLLIDRDGTLIREPEDEQIDSYEKLQFLPGVITHLAQIVRETDYELLMVTNQDGLGTECFPEHTFWPAHQKMLDILEGEGIRFADILIDRSFPHENLPTRKPGTGLLLPYLHRDTDWAHSWVIGDRETDMILAERLGAGGIFIGKQSPKATTCVAQWSEIAHLLLRQSRRANVRRQTHETDIRIQLNLDGTGQSQISTGLGFFDHMLDQLARHGGIDLQISVQGDLHIDEHHTVEDTALSLGQAFDQALGSRKGISRYGFLLPMDDSLAQVAIDFGGRPWLVWEADFRREKIGDMPTELFSHFFKSFSDQARCNLNIRASGQNEHHLIEAIFKGFARAIRHAITRQGDGQLASTKGVL